MESLSLYELGRLIRLTLREGMPDAYWVQAELSEENPCWLRHEARYGPTCTRC